MTTKQRDMARLAKALADLMLREKYGPNASRKLAGFWYGQQLQKIQRVLKGYL